MACAMMTLRVVMQRAALFQGHTDQLAARLFGGLADGFRHFFCFTLAETDATALITYDDKCGEAKALTALNSLGNAIDRDKTFCEFGRFFALVATAAPALITALFTFCHVLASFFR
jgi:hypothetical protein